MWQPISPINKLCLFKTNSSLWTTTLQRLWNNHLNQTHSRLISYNHLPYCGYSNTQITIKTFLWCSSDTTRQGTKCPGHLFVHLPRLTFHPVITLKHVRVFSCMIVHNKWRKTKKSSTYNSASAIPIIFISELKIRKYENYF